jgi:hypothetical protein
MNNPTNVPPGALLRAGQICSDPANGKVGLLPIVTRTWANWAKRGIVSPGVKLGKTRAWPIEEVVRLRESAQQ